MPPSAWIKFLFASSIPLATTTTLQVLLLDEESGRALVARIPWKAEVEYQMDSRGGGGWGDGEMGNL